jgi:hypothetical protein
VKLGAELRGYHHSSDQPVAFSVVGHKDQYLLDRVIG